MNDFNPKELSSKGIDFLREVVDAKASGITDWDDRKAVALHRRGFVECKVLRDGSAKLVATADGKKWLRDYDKHTSKRKR